MSFSKHLLRRLHCEWSYRRHRECGRRRGREGRTRRPAPQELAQQHQLLVNPADGSTVVEEHLRYLLG
jgi:hypothetical protein